MNVLELSEQEIIRRKNLDSFKNIGVDAYPAAEFPVNTNSNEIKKDFAYLSKKEAYLRIAGRIMSMRRMGNVCFVEIQDSVGRLQVYLTCKQTNRIQATRFYVSKIKEGNSRNYNPYTDIRNYITEIADESGKNIRAFKKFIKLLDLGDFIGVQGKVFLTNTGEISLRASRLSLLSKSLKPLPIVKYKDGVAYDKFDDPELRYRQRYVDLVVNEGVKDTFLQRATVIRTIRKVLDEAGYTEVETPTLQMIAGGASARPFTTHFNALDQDMYMRIATELYLKRLIVGGFEGVYEIGKNFRNEGMDRNHNPEFTCMELYVQYKDYNWMMSFTEKLLETVCIAVNGTTEREIDGQMVSFKAPYRRLPILDAIKEKTDFDCDGKTEEEIRAFCLSKGMEVDETMGKGKLIDELFGEFCEGTFIQPTFITDYPVEMSPLTKMHRSKPGLTERFELMVNGKELANAYSELNDPIDQEERFKEQMRLADKGDDEAMIIDQDFLRALQYGMPPTSGIGIGIDRLVMLMTGKTFIQEVLFFPQMKPEKKAPQSSIQEWAAIGVAEDWVYVLRKAGFYLVQDIKDEKAQGLQQKIGDIVKKYKLGYDKPSVTDVQGWIDRASLT